MKQDNSFLKGLLADYVQRITEKSSGGNYVCPLCGSGTGKNHTGAFSIYKEKGVDRWQCFKCHKQGDIFDLIGEVEGVKGYTAQLERAQEIFGGAALPSVKNGNQNYYRNERSTHTANKDNIKLPAYTAFFLEANKHLGEAPTHRGISIETLNKYNIGYVKEWRIPLEAYLASDRLTASGKPRSKETWERIPTSPRLIIPTSESSYLARDTRKEVPAEQAGFVKYKVGAVHLFNADILYSTDKPVFITEGELDALSIIDVGGEACALGSTANTRKLLELFEGRKPTARIILALDNDDEGRKAAEHLKQELLKLDIPFTEWQPIVGYKDANEVIEKDRGFLETAVYDALMVALNTKTADEEAREEYLNSSAYAFIQPLYDSIKASVDTPFLSTGFSLLDSTFDGGLYEGLYILGAISSLGKTTFMLQMADQIAEAGEAQVLFFSLEMSRYELMAKSISRHTAILSAARYGGSLEYAKTVRGITTGRFWYNYDEEQKQLIYDAMDAYGSYAQNIYQLEGIGEIGVKQIREGIEKHIKMTGRKPVCFIDYLQILEPYSDRMTDKQQVDKNVKELKKISRDFKIPIFTVSSFNRMNYAAEAKMEAFKESGAIEYSSDVLLGLQLKGAGEKDFDATKEKAKMPREIELLVLKNRNSAVGKTIAYDYNPMFNLFEEKEAVTPYSNIKVHGKKVK